MSHNQSLYDNVTRSYLAACSRLEVYCSNIAHQLYASIEPQTHRAIGDEAMQVLDFARHKKEFHHVMTLDAQLCQADMDRSEAMALRKTLDDMHLDREGALLYAIAYLPGTVMSMGKIQDATRLSQRRINRHMRLRRQFRLDVDNLFYLYRGVTEQYDEHVPDFDRVADEAITRFRGVYPNVVMR